MPLVLSRAVLAELSCRVIPALTVVVPVQPPAAPKVSVPAVKGFSALKVMLAALVPMALLMVAAAMLFSATVVLPSKVSVLL